MIVCMLALSMEGMELYAAEKKITVVQAQQLGLANSSSYKLLQNKMELAKVKYEQSVKALKLKEKNQTTFRWSPVLDFNFPEDPNLSEAFEYKYKPLEMQSNIEVLRHQISDAVYQVRYSIASLFVKVYVLQEKISYNEKRLAEYEETLEKNKKRLIRGEGNQSDIDMMQKNITSIKTALVTDKANYEAQKKKMADLIGVDVVVGYSFESPFVEGNIDRSVLDMLTEYTLEKDHTYYQAQVEASNALLALNTNYKLMKEQYGSKMAMLDSYINQIKAGEKVDSAAFKLKYNSFLQLIDEPWQGTKNIWFVKIPKEWFKGDIDGVRYVEDEPYILYECALEYQNALKEKESVKKEIINSVTDSFENYMSAKRAVETISKQVEDKEVELKKSSSLNVMGKMTYEEYSAVMQEYEELQIELIQLKADYSEILYGFNRLTCGKIEDLLRGTDVDVTSGKGGYSYAVENEGTGVYYYIHQIASDNVFEMGLTVSDDADVEISHFEFWIDDSQIGARTEVGKTIRHLSLDLSQTSRTFVRIYNGEQFLDDCEIDPEVYSGKLTITKDYTVVSVEDDVIGSYEIEHNQLGMLMISMLPQKDELSAYYNIQTNENTYLISDEKISIKQEFRYLGLAESDMDTLIINLYDENQSYLYQAKFNTTDKTIYKITE